MTLPPSSSQAPLIDTSPDHTDNEHKLQQALNKLETFLTFFGFIQTSLITTTISWTAFIVIGVVTPITLIVYSFCSDCAKYQIIQFELEILFSQGVVAAIALFCVSRNLRKYGVRKLLFVDEYDAYAVSYHKLYVHKINGFFRGLAVWLLVCLLLKTAREVTRVVYLHHDSWWLSAVYLIASLVTWAYSAIIFLSGATLFNFVGNIQVIRIENYGKILEKDLDVSVYIEEHMRLAHYLSKISHRFRVFLLLEFLVVTGSQFAALLQTTQNKGIINFINTGDFAVLSILQLVGIILCLSAASKISHRAQALGSVACRWHALITCDSNDASQSGVSIDIKNTEAVNSTGSLGVNNSESELESDFVPFAIHNQFASASSYHKRQSFVSYVQSNTGGFTIFGWIIDRMLINTIFFIELSLIFFVLGKTITITLRFSWREVESILQVSLLCTQGSPEERPKMGEVIRMLQGQDLAERWAEWEQVEEVRKQEFSRMSHQFAWGEDSTQDQEAIQLSQAR